MTHCIQSNLRCARRDGDVVYQITRDSEIERRLHAQLDRFLIGGAPRSAEAWLTFMMNGVPSLRALGWEITVDLEFPYRITAAGDWYADLQTAQPTRRIVWEGRSNRGNGSTCGSANA